MSRRTVPRPAVVALCALPFLVPAMLASGAFTPTDYVSGGTNMINHRDTDRYAVKIPPFSTYPGLADRIRNAQATWNSALQDTSVDAPEDATNPQITFATADLPNNTKLAYTAPRHQPAIATFNRDGLTPMPGSERRARACRAIGRLMGIKPKDDLTDCMDRDSTAHTNVSQASIDRISAFYDPKASISGPIVSQGPTLHPQSYAFTASAEGHDVAGVGVFFQTLATLDGGPTPEVGIGLAGCTTETYDRCSVDLPLNRDLSTLEPGHYSIRVVAVNDYGDTDSTVYDFYVDFPYFGFNDPWESDELGLGTGTQLETNAFWGSSRIGTNTARMNVREKNLVDCASGAALSPSFDSKAAISYQKLLDAGVRPIIVVYPNCNPAAGKPTNIGGCVQADLDAHPEQVGPPVDATADDSIWRSAAAVLAERYPDALAFEIGNEPNTTRFWGGCEPDPQRYAELLQLAYGGIRTDTSSTIPVISAGLAPGPQVRANEGTPAQYIKREYWVDYLEVLSSLDTRSYSDVQGLHPYRPSNECGAWSEAQSAINQLALASNRAYYALPGLAEPVWVTEVGVSTTGGCRRVTQAAQGAVLSEIYSALRAAAVPVIVFHSYADPGPYPGDGSNVNDWEFGTGLVRSDGNTPAEFIRKPAYCEVMELRGFSRTPCP